MSSKTQQVLKNPIVVGLIAIFCCALWGSAFPCIKIGYSLFVIESGDWASQILFAGLRFSVAGVLTIVLGSALSKRLLYFKRNSIGYVGALALFQTVLQYVFFYIGLANTTGTKGSIINSAGTFFAVLLACLAVKDEKLSAQKLVGCAIGFAGTVIINLSSASHQEGFSFLGDSFVLLSALSYAVSSVMIKQFSKKENPVTLSGYQFLFGGIVMVIFGYLLGGRISIVSVKGVILLVYLSFLSATAYTLWGIILKYNDVSRVAVFGFMTPVFGCIFSALLLKESIGSSAVNTVLALALVSVGIIIVNAKARNKDIKI